MEPGSNERANKEQQQRSAEDGAREVNPKRTTGGVGRAQNRQANKVTRRADSPREHSDGSGGAALAEPAAPAGLAEPAPTRSPASARGRHRGGSSAARRRRSSDKGAAGRRTSVAQDEPPGRLRARYTSAGRGQDSLPESPASASTIASQQSFLSTGSEETEEDDGNYFDEAAEEGTHKRRAMVKLRQLTRQPTRDASSAQTAAQTASSGIERVPAGGAAALAAAAAESNAVANAVGGSVTLQRHRRQQQQGHTEHMRGPAAAAGSISESQMQQLKQHTQLPAGAQAAAADAFSQAEPLATAVAAKAHAQITLKAAASKAAKSSSRSINSSLSSVASLAPELSFSIKQSHSKEHSKPKLDSDRQEKLLKQRAQLTGSSSTANIRGLISLPIKSSRGSHQLTRIATHHQKHHCHQQQLKTRQLLQNHTSHHPTKTSSNLLANKTTLRRELVFNTSRGASGTSHLPPPTNADTLYHPNTTKKHPPKHSTQLTDNKMADQAVIDKLEAGFAKLQAATPERCHSLLKKYLTRDVLDKLKARKTAMGASLLDVAQSGFENLDSGVGIYAPDAESYTLFGELFNPIIEDYHGGFKATDKHPASDFGDLETLVNVDPNNEYVISTRVRCGRSLKGYPFNPCLTEAQYKEMEQKVSTTLKELDGDLAGTYYPLTGMTKETQQQLIDDHFLFKEGDRFLQAANACRYWPTGRGIYHNAAKTFLVWVNEEDHLRIISMQKGGDLKTVFGRLVRGAKSIEAKVPFSRDDRLGFLTFCPTNLGTTIRASVHIKLPKLAADRKKLEEVAGRYNLQVRGTSGEHTESVGGVYDISNKRRLGLTEYQAVREMQDGILELIKIEKSL